VKNLEPKIMEARVRKTENITILMNHDTVEVLGDEQVVTGVALNKTTNEEFEIPVTGFFAIGHKPNTDILRLSL
jgi:thioredoxin reductase (NADPH)